jgi:hypothetical protein
MTRDIDQVIAGVRERVPRIGVEQLKVSHPADDDGLWFFDVQGSEFEVQVEAAYGIRPFLVENNANDERRWCATVEEAIEVVSALFLNPPLGDASASSRSR